MHWEPIAGHMKIMRAAFLALMLILNLVPGVLPAPVCSQPLKARIEHSENLAPVPSGLMQGGRFDEQSLPPLTPKNKWSPVPSWLAGTWQFKTETVTHMRLFTKDASYPPVPFVLRNEFQKTFGCQKDKSGQIWDYVKAPYSYTCKLDEGYLGYNRCESVDVIAGDPREYVRRVVGPDSVIDPNSQQILLTQQKECFSRYSQLGDDAVRVDGSTKIFDMQGNSKVLKISNMAAMRVKPFEAIDEKDGENLKQLFSDFLKANGKADLLPD